LVAAFWQQEIYNSGLQDAKRQPTKRIQRKHLFQRLANPEHNLLVSLESARDCFDAIPWCAVGAWF